MLWNSLNTGLKAISARSKSLSHTQMIFPSLSQKCAPHFSAGTHNEGWRVARPLVTDSSHAGLRDFIRFTSIVAPQPQGHSSIAHFGGSPTKYKEARSRLGSSARLLISTTDEIVCRRRRRSHRDLRYAMNFNIPRAMSYRERDVHRLDPNYNCRRKNNHAAVQACLSVPSFDRSNGELQYFHDQTP